MVNDRFSCVLNNSRGVPLNMIIATSGPQVRATLLRHAHFQYQSFVLMIDLTSTVHRFSPLRIHWAEFTRVTGDNMIGVSTTTGNHPQYQRVSDGVDGTFINQWWQPNVNSLDRRS